MDTWFPELRVDLLDLIPVQYDPAFARGLRFYVCPGHSRTRKGRTRDPCGGRKTISVLLGHAYPQVTFGGLPRRLMI